MEQAWRLKQALDSEPRRYRNQAYLPELRSRVVAHARACRARGESWSRIAESLGLSGDTVRRWCVEAGSSGGVDGESTALVPVELGDTGERPPAPLVLVSPGGWRVEGLSAAELAHLVGALP